MEKSGQQKENVKMQQCLLNDRRKIFEKITKENFWVKTDDDHIRC